MSCKNLRIIPVFLFLSQMAIAQMSPKKGPQIGFSGNLTDFSASVPKVGEVHPGFSLMYWNGLSNHFDYSIRYNGIFSEYTKNTTVGSSGYINELEGALHARLLNNAHTFNPFLTAGYGVGNYAKKIGTPYVPLGGGVQINMADEGSIYLQANYRKSIREAKLDDNMFYSLGFTQNLRNKKEEIKPLPPVVEEVKVQDRDNDGVADAADACPDTPGLAALNGCPDKDGDGIADKDDKCPDVAGLPKYNGCPIPDTDKDGINDEQDKCIDVPGVAKYGGCPVPDRDKDGVADEDDKCPDLAGPASNNGCPEIKEEVKKKIDVAAQKIYFATGSAKLLATSNASLNEVAKILQTDQDLKLDISGHTDNTGKADKNQVLSENRAKSVYDYLLKKGVAEARLKSAGFGQDQPIADNKTAAGRSKNRRVEMQLHYD